MSQTTLAPDSKAKPKLAATDEPPPKKRPLLDDGKEPRHVLPFEQPLAKLEQQIAELEQRQNSPTGGRAVDCTAELRELREN